MLSCAEKVDFCIKSFQVLLHPAESVAWRRITSTVRESLIRKLRMKVAIATVDLLSIGGPLAEVFNESMVTSNEPVKLFME